MGEVEVSSHADHFLTVLTILTKVKVKALINQNKLYNLNVDEYRQIGAPEQVLDWLSHGAKLEFSSAPEPCFYQNRVFSEDHIKFLDQEIERLLTTGAICEVQHK